MITKTTQGENGLQLKVGIWFGKDRCGDLPPSTLNGSEKNYFAHNIHYVK